MTPAEARKLGPLGPKLVESFHHWSQCMAARFGTKVMMIGSALYSPTPRDIDIRIVISDHEFFNRYGKTEEEWRDKDRGQIWIDDMAKMNRTVVKQMMLNADVQVWPKSHWKTWEPLGLEPLVLADVSPSWCIVPGKKKAGRKRA